MKTSWTPETLAGFEKRIADRFLNREIRSPIHLAGGNEAQLIEMFDKHVEPHDWLCLSWRSHLHCLLKGVPEEQVEQAIISGKSISLTFPKYRIISSAIVGGILPIAVGLAAGIKRQSKSLSTPYAILARRVVCFLGEMTAMTGTAYEAMRYAYLHELPVKWIIEDNGMSTDTDTWKTWGKKVLPLFSSVIRYQYVRTYPHVGCGQFVSFEEAPV